MTPRQAEALTFIRSFIADHGHSPSYVEMCDGFGLRSKSGVHRLVYALRDQGHISLADGRARSIAVTSVSHDGEMKEQVFGAIRVFRSNGMALPSKLELAVYLETTEVRIEHALRTLSREGRLD